MVANPTSISIGAKNHARDMSGGSLASPSSADRAGVALPHWPNSAAAFAGLSNEQMAASEDTKRALERRLC